MSRDASLVEHWQCQGCGRELEHDAVALQVPEGCLHVRLSAQRRPDGRYVVQVAQLAQPPTMRRPAPAREAGAGPARRHGRPMPPT